MEVAGREDRGDTQIVMKGAKGQMNKQNRQTISRGPGGGVDSHVSGRVVDYENDSDDGRFKMPMKAQRNRLDTDASAAGGMAFGDDRSDNDRVSVYRYMGDERMDSEGGDIDRRVSYYVNKDALY